MKAFQKLALVSAIAMTSSAFALEAADDATLAAATGQDGITIKIAPGPLKAGASAPTAAGLTDLGVSAATQTAIDVAGPGGPGADGLYKGLYITQTVVHDDDGMTGNVRSGALVIGDGTMADSTVIFADNTSPIVVDIDMIGDASASAGDQAQLNVKITTPTLAIKTGNIYVAASNAESGNGVDDNNGDTVVSATEINGSSYSSASGAIMNGLEIILGATTINIQLGTESQTISTGVTAQILVNASITGGLTINNLNINDTSGVIQGGAVHADTLSIVDAGGANLTANVGVNAGSFGGLDGLWVTVAQLGSAVGGANMTLNNVRLGTAAAATLGDVQMLGLHLAGTSMVISGH